MSITIILTTYRRPSILKRTLEAMTRVEALNTRWELIVVDNADDRESQTTCQAFRGELPLRYLVFSRPGKNAALNFGLQYAAGDLIVFIDDDVLPAADWLCAMRDGANRWPNHVLFGGQVRPDWPFEPPDFVRRAAEHPDQGRWTYSVLDRHVAEGPCAGFLPIGNNMAVRRRVFDEGLQFDESIGPKGRSYAMGSETEFNMRLKRLGVDAVYLPKALVFHQIRPEQMTRGWLIGRAFREGRGEARLRPDNSIHGVCRSAAHVLRAVGRHACAAIRRNQAQAIAMQMWRARSIGRLYETIRMGCRLT